jgi:hypothetical protein
MADIRCLNEAHRNNFAAYHGDCIDVLRQLPDQSIDFSIYSPPFANLFVYSDSEADMGNCSNDGEFFEHYKFALKDLLRMTRPGRLSAVHCSDLPSHKWKHGFVGLRDFPGEIIKAHQDAGWIYHSRVTVWRDPVVEMTRTKALGLLYKQLQKDSTKSRQGMADYVCVFKAPGENLAPVEQKPARFPLMQWQKWASPVWMDINQSNTLNVAMAREHADERHMCPLQLDLITRCLIMWSNPGETVLSPFMGIGSEGVQSLREGRKFLGIELKESYWRHACEYLTEADAYDGDLFSQAAAE